MGFALLFSGQGLQHPQMLAWLPDTGLPKLSADHPPEHWRAQLVDPAAAGRNAVAQPLLTALALSAWAQLAPLLPSPDAIAGYSVGELAAFSAAGVFDASTAVALAVRRAAAMDRCAAGRPATGLLGISGIGTEALHGLCTRFGIAVAIRNGPATAVLGGPRDALAAAADAARGQGAHCAPLNIAMASHTEWMSGAAASFAEGLSTAALRPPRTALFGDFTGGRLRGVPELRHALAAQIDHRVRWDECMDGVAERGVRCVLEIGAGSALARLWNERHPQVPARAADDFRSADAVARWVGRFAS